jgi:hypothetical protein
MVHSGPQPWVVAEARRRARRTTLWGSKTRHGVMRMERRRRRFSPMASMVGAEAEMSQQRGGTNGSGEARW